VRSSAQSPHTAAYAKKGAPRNLAIPRGELVAGGRYARVCAPVTVMLPVVGAITDAPQA